MPLLTAGNIASQSLVTGKGMIANILLTVPPANYSLTGKVVFLRIETLINPVTNFFSTDSVSDSSAIAINTSTGEITFTLQKTTENFGGDAVNFPDYDSLPVGQYQYAIEIRPTANVDFDIRIQGVYDIVAEEGRVDIPSAISTNIVFESTNILLVMGETTLNPHLLTQHSDVNIGSLIANDFLVRNASNQWVNRNLPVVDVFRGSMALNAGTSDTLNLTSADTWIEYIPSAQTTYSLYNMIKDANNRLKIDYSGSSFAPTGNLNYSITVFASVDIILDNRIIEMTIAKNGSLTTDNDILNVRVGSGGSQTAGLIWPFTLSLPRILGGNNNDVFGVYFRSPDTGNIEITSFYISLFGSQPGTILREAS